MGRPLPQMRRGEIIGGAIWLLIYLFLGSVLVELALLLLGIDYDLGMLNAVYFLADFLITALVFHRFLTESLTAAGRNVLRVLRGILLGFAVYWLFQMGLSLLEGLSPQAVELPNDENIAAIASENYRIMWAGAVLLAPLTEETLLRGLVFGNLRKKNRILAYAITALLFAGMHMLAFLGEMGPWSIFYNLLTYGLPSIALCICYERAGTIWAPIVLHTIVNAIGMAGI